MIIISKNQTIHELIVNVENSTFTVNPPLDIHQGDTCSHVMLIKLRNNEDFISLDPSITYKLFYYRTKDKTLIETTSVNVVNYYRGVLSSIISNTVVNNYGNYTCYLKGYLDENVISTVSFTISVSKAHDYVANVDEVVITKEFYDELKKHLNNKDIHLSEADKDFLDTFNNQIEELTQVIDRDQRIKDYYFDQVTPFINIPTGLSNLTGDMIFIDKVGDYHSVNSPAMINHVIDSNNRHNISIVSNNDILVYEETINDYKYISFLNIDQKLKTKLDKYQGIEYSGKAIVVNDEGYAVPSDIEVHSYDVDNITIEAIDNVLQVKDGGISTDKIANNAVTEEKLSINVQNKINEYLITYTISEDPNTGEFVVTCDKTLAEIKAAHMSGRELEGIGIYNGGTTNFQNYTLAYEYWNDDPHAGEGYNTLGTLVWENTDTYSSEENVYVWSINHTANGYGNDISITNNNVREVFEMTYTATPNSQGEGYTVICNKAGSDINDALNDNKFFKGILNFSDDLNFSINLILTSVQNTSGKVLKWSSTNVSNQDLVTYSITDTLGSSRTIILSTWNSNIYATDSDLSNEITNRENADTALQGNIDIVSSNLSDEVINRQNADNGLQQQIDAITVSSDVIDVLGTYAELLVYDTSHVKPNDIIKVLTDEEHGDATTYYRWINILEFTYDSSTNTITYDALDVPASGEKITISYDGHTQETYTADGTNTHILPTTPVDPSTIEITSDTYHWEYVGSEGPYYTKSEANTLLQGKVDVAQGVGNAGEVMIINNQGNVTPGDVGVDNSTIEVNNHQLRVKAGGITSSQLSQSVNDDIAKGITFVATYSYTETNNERTYSCDYTISEILEKINQGYNVVAHMTFEEVPTEFQLIIYLTNRLYFSAYVNNQTLNIEHSSSGGTENIDVISESLQEELTAGTNINIDSDTNTISAPNVYNKTEINNLLNAKVDISQGVANSGKTLGINSSGNVEPSGDIYNKFEVVYTATYDNQTDTYTITNCNHTYSEISAAISAGYDLVIKLSINYSGDIDTTELQFVDITDYNIVFSASASEVHMNIEHSSQNTYSFTMIQFISTNNIVQSTGISEEYIMSQDAVTRELNAKQDELTAGDSIDITNNVISATGTKYLVTYTSETVSDVTTYSCDKSYNEIVTAINNGYNVIAISSDNSTQIEFQLTTYNSSANFLRFEAVEGTNSIIIEHTSLGSITMTPYSLQQQLTAGSNININNNTISATDTIYSAGQNISINQNNQISAGIEVIKI